MKRLICFMLVSVLLMTQPFLVSGATQKKDASKQYYKINGRTITVKAKNGKDISKALNIALREAAVRGNSKKIYTVKVPAGTYPVNDVLHVYGNVTLDLSAGVTLNCVMSSGNMLLLGDSTINVKKSRMKKYGTIHNITVLGGTFKGNKKNTSSLIRMAHSRNVTFDGCVLTGGGCAHQMEVAAIDGFTAKNCTFKDMPGNNSGEKQEALQLDIPCGNYIFHGTVLDGTPMKNVTVKDCTFQNVPRGVGSHSMIVGVYFDNVRILNNHFKDVKEEAIVCLGYRNCEISRNVIEDCGAGILFQYFKPNVQSVYKSIYDGKTAVNYPVKHDADATITKNEIHIVPSKAADKSVAVKVYGYDLTKDTKATGHGSHDTIPKNDYYVSNVTVSENNITSSGHGIQFFDVKDSAILNNTVKCTGDGKYDGIFLEFATKNVAVRGNHVSDTPRYGICVQGKSNARTIADNVVASPGSYGIYLYDHSGVTENIENNEVTHSKAAAIFLNKNSSVEAICKNTVTLESGKGIFVYNQSVVKKDITDNNIQNL